MPEGEVVCLIKPQFEAGKEKVGKKGVVKDINVHFSVVRNIVDFALGLDFSVEGLEFSPIKGPEGNIEYLMYIKNNGENSISYSHRLIHLFGYQSVTSLILLFVKEEIVLCRIVWPDVFDAFVDFAVIFKLFKVLYNFEWCS